jgi:hypothetical protein
MGRNTDKRIGEMGREVEWDMMVGSIGVEWSVWQGEWRENGMKNER